MSRARIWYAEDIADIMERQQTQSLKQIAKAYGVSDKTLADMTCKARARGFAAYPKRSAT